MKIDLTEYDAVTFDCYGTLIDWDSGVANILGPWAVRSNFPDSVSALIEKFAERQYANQCLHPFKNYREVLHDAISEAVASMASVMDTEQLDTFAASVGTWPAFTDTIDSLRTLKSRGLHLGILSNVDNSSFAESHLRLGGLIDTIVTAEMVQTYKPDLKMFEALFEALQQKGIHKDRILHVAQSRFHDAAPGEKIGLDVIWIDRRYGRPGKGVTIPSEVKPYAKFNSLEAFCEACKI